MSSYLFGYQDYIYICIVNMLNNYAVKYIHSDNRDHHVVCGQLSALGCERDHHVSYHGSDDYEYVRGVHMTTTMIIIIMMITL